jgi:hypothetical protein
MAEAFRSCATAATLFKHHLALAVAELRKPHSRNRRWGTLLLGAVLILWSMPSTAFPQVINQKVVRYMVSNKGNQIGGGESADAVSEALRVSGGAFTSVDLGTDYPSDGDRMWGTPIKFLSYANDKFTDSNPPSKVQPGDILQYSGTKFVYVTTKGRKTTTTTISTNRHTVVVSKVDKKGVLPTEVYEQNGPTNLSTASTREIGQSSIDFGALKAGWVLVYRPKVRVDAPQKFQISLVNNTSSAKAPVLKSGLNNVMNLSLDPANKTASYIGMWATSPAPDKELKLVLPNGSSMAIENGCGYEIYKRTSGVVSIRKLAP